MPVRQAYDYIAPRQLEPGIRVVVPFGRRKLIGIIVSNHRPSADFTPAFTIRPVEQVLDQECSIGDNMLELLHWAAGYYHHPIGKVLNAALPARLRIAKPLENPVTETVYRSLPGLDHATTDKSLARAHRQRALFELVCSHDWISAKQIKSLSRDSSCPIRGLHIRGLLTSLLDKGFIESRIHTPITLSPGPKPFQDSLTEQQQLAITAVASLFGKFKSFVLHGITGSGKTEVYLHITEICITQGRQALVLVPEIALTPQLVERFTERFGHGVCVIHSSITDQQRYRTWWKARAGNATVVLGTRSAVFTPMKNPGLIIVDEEHDISYKQQDGFRYHARDLAIKRASLEGVPIVLGSATPSMESMNNVASGRHQLLTLSHRIGAAELPKVELVDLKIFPLHEGISSPLLEAISRGLDRQQQTILYINRRGFAPIVQCRACAWQANCDRCDAFLTFHKKTNTFRCHHCSKITNAQSNCLQCEQTLFYTGIGTQRIEKTLIEQFPQARISRFDRDQINTQKKLERTLKQINDGKVDIVIGTQLISKGHDFPGVTLVGVIDPDQGLYSVDFRAPEYLFQQLVQVAGRAGRSKTPSRVIIQTAHPENPYLHLIRDYNFDQFYRCCTEERELVKLPPFGHIALWRAESTNDKAGLQFLQFVSQTGRKILTGKRIKGIVVMDPISSPMEKLAGKFRAQLLIKADQRKSLHELLAHWLKEIENSPASRKVRWSIDIDPMEMF